MSDDDTVKIRVTSGMNITFDHVLDTTVPKIEWDDMSQKDQDDMCVEMILDAIEWYVVGE